jgi:hypothetical protein
MTMTKKELSEVIAEISEWPLQQRRDYIAAIETAFGKDSAQQIRDGLTALWQAKTA